MKKLKISVIVIETALLLFCIVMVASNSGKRGVGVPQNVYLSAYEEIISECSKINDYAEGNTRFALAHINDDDIPELIVAIGDYHAASAMVYAYYGGEVIHVDNFGGYGSFQYVPRTGRIMSGYMSNGDLHVTFYELDRDSVLKELRKIRFCHTLETPYYEIEGHLVSESECDEEYKRQMGDYDWYSAEYSNYFEFNEENINTMLTMPMLVTLK